MSVDSKKTFLITFLSSLTFFTSLQENSIVLYYFPNGEISLALAGYFRYFALILGLILGIMFFIYFLKIHLNTSKKEKKYSILNLLGGISIGILSPFASITGISIIIPGIHMVFVAIGALFVAISFWKCPQLAYNVHFVDKNPNKIFYSTKEGNIVINKIANQALLKIWEIYAKEIFFQEYNHLILNTIESKKIFQIEKKKENRIYSLRFEPGINNEKVAIFIYDITKNKNREEKIKKSLLETKILSQILEHKISFNKKIQEISTQLVNCPTYEIDNQINISLDIIGQFFNIDRAFLYRFSHDNDSFELNYQWCRKDLELKTKINFTKINSHNFPCFMEHIKKLKYIKIQDSSNLTKQELQLKKFIEKLNIKSVIYIPLFLKKKLFGFIGFDSIKTELILEDDEIDLLWTTGDLIVHSIIRKQQETKVKIATNYLVNLNTIISIGNSAPNLAFFLEKIMRIISKVLKFPISAVLLISQNGNDIKLKYHKNVSTVLVEEIKKMSFDDPLFVEIISKRRCHFISDYSLIPEEKRSKIQFPNDKFALVNIPLLNGITAIGCLCFLNTIPYIFTDNQKKVLITITYELNSVITRLKAEEEIKKSLIEKEVLLKEIHHRVKNNLQIISGILYLQSFNNKDGETVKIFQGCQNQIKSMALVHEKLYQSKSLSKINMKGYIESLLSNLYTINSNIMEQLKLKLDIDDLEFDIAKAIPCGLILNELITNSLKHAFPNGRNGEITILLKKSARNKINLTIKDNGVGFIDNFDYINSEGLGTQLISSLVEQLHGEIEIFNRSGITIVINFEL